MSWLRLLRHLAAAAALTLAAFDAVTQTPTAAPPVEDLFRRSQYTVGSVDVLRVLWQTDERLIVYSGSLQQVESEPPIDTVDLYKFDTTTGTKTLLSFESPGAVTQWVADFDGVPRAVVSNSVTGDTSAWYVRKGAQDPWTKVEEAKLGRLYSTPLRFDPGGKILYVAARRNGEDRSAIYEYDVEKGQWGNAVIRHPERDVESGNASFVIDYRTRKLLGLRYSSDRPSVEWFDATWAKIQKSVDAALPDTVNHLQGSADAKRWVVVAYSDRNPGDVYLLDGKTMRMEKLFSYASWIDPKKMAATKWVRYAARDGMTIPALLTVPESAHGKPVPLIVDIHGGPYVEAASWGFNREVQFFASRGYAVLQPQFRGTEGFGWKLYSVGFRKWGDEMQDDLEDGVKWAVAQGIADPSRVCFFGASYGGYAAIFGAIKNASSIKCSVAFVGVTSIAYLFDNAQTDLSRIADRSTWMHHLIGDPKTDRARFKRVSPLDNADKVGVPILLAYGGSDLRVPLAHGTDFRSALDQYHKEYEWVQYAAEGHGFKRDENVFDFYNRVDRFLAKYLKADRAAPNATASPQR